MDSTHGALQTEGELARQRQRIHAHASRSSAVTVRGPGQDQRRRRPRKPTAASRAAQLPTAAASARSSGRIESPRSSFREKNCNDKYYNVVEERKEKPDWQYKKIWIYLITSYLS